MQDYIGRYVKEFESGSKGSLALGSCGNDWGLSCGSYQLTLRWGNCIRFLKKYFPEVAKDLYFNNLGDIATPSYPGTRYCSSPTDVKKVWMLCYESVGEDKFFEYEHEYIQDAYYEPLMKKLVGLFNPNNHSRALQECCWSWSVHKSSGGAYNAIKELSKNINLQTSSVEVLLNRFYDYRYNVNKYTRYSTERCSERNKLLGIKNMQPLPYKGSNPSDGSSVNVSDSNSTVDNSNAKLQCGIYRIICDELNVRSGPGVSYKVNQVVRRNQAFTIVEIKNGTWGRLKSGAGWINCHSKYCLKVDGNSTTNDSSKSFIPPFTFRISCEVLNIHKEPKIGSERTGQISDKLKYTIVEVKGNWGKLKSGIGWVSLDYITKC